MASLKSELKVSTPKEDFSFVQSEPYNEVFTIRKQIDNSDGFMVLWSASKTTGTYGYNDIKSMVIKNTTQTPIELQLVGTWYEGSTSATLDTQSANRYVSWLLKGGEFIYLPGIRMVGYDSYNSAANAGKVEGEAGYDTATTLKVDSTADADNVTATDNVVGSATNTTVYLEPYTDASNCTANLFVVGDYIRIDDEIMEVTAIGDKSDLANNTLTVIRGVKGSTAATDAANEDPIEFPIFNTQEAYNKYTYLQTNNSGRLTTSNLLGYGRNLIDACTGIVPGSLAIKFYTKGYQELGLSGITPNTDSGLTAGTTYQFTIAVDGGSAYDLDLAVDSSNTKFGGTNGIISKLNAIFTTQRQTSGSNLFEKSVTCSIVNGDIRFTSNNRTRASAVALGDSSGGDTDIWGVGRIPAVGSVNTAVASRIPTDTILDRAGFNEIANVGIFSYDDGHGNIVGGECSGKINYETGAIDIKGPSNAEPIFDFRHDSAHSGGNHFTNYNVISSISARAINSKIKPTIEIVGFN